MCMLICVYNYLYQLSLYIILKNCCLSTIACRYFHISVHKTHYKPTPPRFALSGKVFYTVPSPTFSHKANFSNFCRKSKRKARLLGGFLLSFDYLLLKLCYSVLVCLYSPFNAICVRLSPFCFSQPV